MSQSGPPADAKQAQAAAIQEIEAAKKKKNAIDSQLVRSLFNSQSKYNLM
jgi:chromatin modification-related protein EAF6